MPVRAAKGAAFFLPVLGRAASDRRSAVTIRIVDIEGRHGTDPNVAVRIGAVPYTVPEHECRGTIAPGRDCVHSTSLRPPLRVAIATTKPMERLRGCSCARAAGSKC
jgi:hypothetical protein